MSADSTTHLTQRLQAAHELYNAGDMEGAIARCLEIHAEHPTNTGNLLLLGAANFQLRKFSESLQYNQKAIDVDPNFAEAYGNMGNVYKEYGDVDKALALYKKAAELKPNFADVHGNMASVYLARGMQDLAMQHYKLALTHNSQNACWHVDLGHLYRLAGQVADAKSCFMEAIRLQPNFAIAWSNLACVNKDEKDVETSILHYRKAVELDPNFFDAYSNLGNVYKDSGRLAEAKQTYLQALQLRPDSAVVIGNLAAVQLELGEVQASLGTFQRALDIEPNFPDALSNMGNALKILGKLPESIDAYQRALKLNPNHTDALNNLANALKDSGDSVQAEALYKRAIELRPDFAGAHSNLGNLLKEQHKLEGALAAYTAAIQADPTFADAYSNRGNALKDLCRFDDAIMSYTRAIELRPTFADAYGNLASVYKDTGQLDKAISYYRYALRLKNGVADPIAFCNLVHCLQTICDWTERDSVFAKTREIITQQMRNGQVPAVQPHHALVYPLDAEQQFCIAQHYAAAAEKNVRVLGLPPTQYEPLEQAARLSPDVPPRRIRIGYVSSDLGNHPLAHLMKHVFLWHDKSKYEVICYATSPNDGSEWRRDIMAGVEHFKEVHLMSHSTLADFIRKDEIDVLINLNGYTKGSRNEVFALRPAPVQVMYLGFPGSSGATYMQYWVSDEVSSPPALDKIFSETLVYMPHCYFVNDHAQTYPDAYPALTDEEVNEIRALYGLPPRPAVVFCMFNQLYKIDPDIFDVWCRILQRVPGSVLWLLQFPATGEPNIRREAMARGIGPDKLIFTPVAAKYDHIKRGRAADLFLDTPMCNAHTTGTDILWGGTPMLTLPGPTLASRVGASLLRAIDLPELIAPDATAYEKIAVELASDVPKLRALQERLQGNRLSSPLFDTRRWVVDWERSLEACVQHYRTRCKQAVEDFERTNGRKPNPGEVAEPTGKTSPVELAPSPSALFGDLNFPSTSAEARARDPSYSHMPPPPPMVQAPVPAVQQQVVPSGPAPGAPLAMSHAHHQLQHQQLQQQQQQAMYHAQLQAQQMHAHAVGGFATSHGQQPMRLPVQQVAYPGVMGPRGAGPHHQHQPAPGSWPMGGGHPGGGGGST